MKPIAKYKFGLAVICAFTLVLLVVVLVQAAGAKQDNRTYKAANKIADKLNGYTLNHYNAPRSLEAVGIKDVPETITYRRTGSNRFELCETYKSDSNNFDATYLEMQLITGGRASQMYPQSDSQETSYLYVSPYHRKGKNCQKIRLYGYYGTPNSSTENFGSSSSQNVNLD